MSDDKTRGHDCRILRSILTELSSKKDGFPHLILHKYQLAGHNDNYLRTMTSDTFREITECSADFAKAVELKVLHKIRNESLNSDDSYPLPTKAGDASAQDIEDAVSFYLSNSAEFTQKYVIDKFFYNRNVHIPASTLCRKLKSRRLNFETSRSGRPQLLEDWICRDVITPALVQFRAIGRTKWKGLLRMLMKQLARAQRGIGEVQGIMQLVQNRQRARGADDAGIVRDIEDDEEDDASSHSTEAAELEILDASEEAENAEFEAENAERIHDHASAVHDVELMGGGYHADHRMNPSDEELNLQDMRKRLRQHSSLNLTKVELAEFPTPRTFQRYCKKYKWTQRKIELMAPHRQNGSSPARIEANYAELKAQYEQHDIQHPNQIIVCDEIHWCKEWGDILDFIKGICESACKRSQSDGPARLKDGVTVCPFGTIIGHLYLVQVIVKKSQKLNKREIQNLMVRNGFAAESILVSETESGYQTADSFREAVEALIFALHADQIYVDGIDRNVDDDIESIRLSRKFLLIADGSSTHPFHDIGFSLLIALAGLFFHQQEPDSTHACNLYDKFNFLQTKLYSAKEVTMHLALKFAPRICNDRQATVWIEEIIGSLAKTIDISSDVCPHDISITDEAVLLKFETILKCRDASFDTMHLMECIMPALARGMTSHVTIASAKAVGLLPIGFKLTPDYDFAANVDSWRGPFVEQVLRQSCVQGQAQRELRMERWQVNKAAVIQENMSDFGFDIFRAGLEADGPTKVDRNVLDATLATCFANDALSQAQKEQMDLFLNVYEQKKKEEAKRLKDSKSRAAISSVNGRSAESLAEENLENSAIESANAAEKLSGQINRAYKKADEAIKQIELLANRSKKCADLLTQLDSALGQHKDTGALIKTCKRTVDWAHNNADNAGDLWDAASEERTKIQRLGASEAVTAFTQAFVLKEDRMYEHNADTLIIPVIELALAVRETAEDDWGAEYAP